MWEDDRLREHAATGLSTNAYSSGRATYEDCGRVRILHSHRYRVTGMRIVLCYQRQRILSTALGAVFDKQTGPLALLCLGSMH